MRTLEPFHFNEIMHLLQYLTDHSERPATSPPFELKLKSYQPEGVVETNILPTSTGNLVEATLYMRVGNMTQIQQSMSGSNNTQVIKISWKGAGRQSVTIDCLYRSVHVSTDSISFLELVRHQLTGQQVRKLSANLHIA